MVDAIGGVKHTLGTAAHMSDVAIEAVNIGYRGVGKGGTTVVGEPDVVGRTGETRERIAKAAGGGAIYKEHRT